MTKAYIEEGVADDREEFEWRRMFALVAAAVMYCAGAGWLIAVSTFSTQVSISPDTLLKNCTWR